jgi:hypothetical protein
MLTVSRILFEFSYAGRVEKMVKLYTMPVDPYSTMNDYTRAVFEILFFLMYLYYVFVEVDEIRVAENVSMYLSDLWNIIECVNLILYGVVVIFYFKWYFDPIVRDIYGEVILKDGFVDMYNVARGYELIALIAAVNCLFGFIKVFKFLQLSSRMTLLWDTLRYAFYDLLSMLLVFFLIVMGFATMTHLVYGSNIEGYHTLDSSISVLLRILIGEFDYEKHVNTNSYFTPFFFSIYIFIVFFVIINMFIAVVSEYYERVKTMEALEMKNETDPLVVSFYDKMRISLLKLFTKCYKKKPETDIEMHATGDAASDASEIRSNVSDQVGEEVANIFVKRWKTRSHSDRYYGGAFSRMRKNFSRRIIVDKRTEVKHEISKIITFAEDRLSRSNEDRPRTDLYSQFIKIWDTLTDKQKEDTLRAEDLEVILESRDDALKLVRLYNEYWVHDKKIREYDGMDTIEGMLRHVMNKVTTLERSLSSLNL